MITDKDLQLSKISFTDKDFASLYPDLLDLAKQLTNEWDPGQGTNESDPGVVLLKEGAFIADHTNYNIDKNILEAFLPSATQDRSVRNITEMNGYTPRYYISAEGEISCACKPSSLDPNTRFSFTIPAFTLVLSNGDKAYTQVSNLSIRGYGIPSVCTFMEGTINDLTVQGESVISLVNLDDNNRIYLPNPYVAQNGIFIRNIVDSGTDTDGWDSQEIWVKNNYLSTQPLGSKIYKFDYDSVVGLPYIEFPSDIANLIGEGLQIKYMTTSGSAGNIFNTESLSVVSPTIYKVGDLNLVLSGDSPDMVFSLIKSFRNGKDPETIDEMYRSFKKVVGTFDTLVTCRDYSNAIYTLEDDYNLPFISNGVVTDIRNDYNHALNVITYDQYGEYFENISLNDPGTIKAYNLMTSAPVTPAVGDVYPSGGHFVVVTSINPTVTKTLSSISYDDFVDYTKSMSPYDLCIYALTAYKEANWEATKPEVAIAESFKPVDEYTLSEIKYELEKLKCINHTYRKHTPDEVYYFKNVVPLVITVSPYKKLMSVEEKEEIINDIKIALTQNFNAREVDFGEELNYDEVYKVIVNANSNIRTIRLEDFDYNPTAVRVSDDGEIIEESVYDSTNNNLLVDMVAKNVLAGRLCLFNFDDTFNYEYGQSNLSTFEDILEISTESYIPIELTEGEVGVTDTSETRYQFNTQPSSSAADTWNIYINEDPVSIAAHSYYEGPFNVTIIDVNGNVWSYNSGNNIKLKINNDSNNALVFSQTSEMIYRDSTYVTTISIDDNVTLSAIDSHSQSMGYNLTPYTVKPNEYVQVAYPNYYSTKIYPGSVWYRFSSATSTATDIIAYSNAEYKLKSDESLVFIYKQGGKEYTDIYTGGTIVKPNFDLYYTDYLTQTVTGTTKEWSNYGSIRTDIFTQLRSEQQIGIREILETQLSDVAVPCYWITSTPGNILFKEDDEFVILGSGEYFIYSNTAKDSMVILGAGTKLIKPAGDVSQWALGDVPVNIESINNEGYNAGITWVVKDFSNGSPLRIQEMNILTLSEGDSMSISGINIDGGSEEDITTGIDNTWKTLKGLSNFKFEYVAGGESGELVYNSSYDYLIRSRLDLSLSNTEPQRLVEGQTITVLTSSSREPYVITPESSSNELLLQSSLPLDVIGDEDINLTPYSNISSIGLMSYSTEKPKLVVNQLEYVGDSDEYTIADISSSISQWYLYNAADGKYEHVTQDYVNNLLTISGSANTKLDDPLISSETAELYHIAEETKNITSENLIENNGDYVFTLSEPIGEATFPFGYYVNYYPNALDNKQYILPVYVLNGSEQSPITVEIIDAESSESILISDFNYTEDADYISITKTGMYLITPNIMPEITSSDDEGPYEIKKDLILKVSWSGAVNSSSAVQVKSPEVFAGINASLAGVSLYNVLNRMSELVENSTKPNIKPYYIHKPHNDLAIQDEDILNPNIFWDKNNVANGITIPYIDLENTDIEITKSMRGYSEKPTQNNVRMKV